MKTEVIRGNVYKTDAELRGTLGSYINKYYNATRMHSGINYCSPMEYEALAALHILVNYYLAPYWGVSCFSDICVT